MRIAVITEVSTVSRNKDIMAALEDLGYQALNVGMKGDAGEAELSIVESGFLTGLLLNLDCVDLVIGGCGTGQGYMNCALQYPGVVCGLINDPLNAYLFPQINNGNAVSLALNKDYGWGGEVNLRFIIEKLLSAPRGGGYPAHRAEPQKIIRAKMAKVNSVTHRSFMEILQKIDAKLLENSLKFPGVRDIIEKNADHTLALYIQVMRFYQNQ